MAGAVRGPGGPGQGQEPRGALPQGSGRSEGTGHSTVRQDSMCPMREEAVAIYRHGYAGPLNSRPLKGG